jgi:hypothetical protein
MSLAPRPVTNDGMMTRTEIGPQGQFVMKGFPGLDYTLNTALKSASAPPTTYVKDATYGELSVRRRWMRIGSASGDARLHITLGTDGGFVKASAADSSGKVAPNCHILILPAVSSDEGALADAMVMAQAGPAGDFLSPVLPPGKYYVLATDDLIDKTPESMAAIRGSRDRVPGRAPGAVGEPQRRGDAEI